MKVALLLRGLVLSLLLIALLRPVLRLPTERLAISAAVDLSASVDEASLAEALQLVEDLEASPVDLQIVAFAADTLPVDDLEALQTLNVYDSRELAETGRATSALEDVAAEGLVLDRSASRLSEAVTTAAALIPEDRVGRVLLLSDGLGTDGSLRDALAPLLEREVRVHTVPLATVPGPAHLASLRTTETPRAGAATPALLEIVSPSAETIELTIREGAGARRTVPVDVSRGRSFVELDLSFDESGDQPLRVEIEGTDQRLLATVPVAPQLTMLVMESGEPSRELWNQLSESGWRIERHPVPLPLQPRDLTQVDVVILSDTSANDIPERTFLTLEDFVLERAGSLLFASGESSFGEEGWAGGRLETLLPVKFRVEEEKTDVALMIALDKSYSMKGDKIDLAKEATKAALGELRDEHRFGLVAFDWNTYDVVPLQDASERDSIAERIGRIEASAQTNFFPALESCFRQLRDEEAEVKHVILISDGKTYPDDYQGLVTRMQEAEITVSTVGVGEEADRELLADIARWGKGKSYFVRDASRVQRILLDEARRKQTDTLVEKPTRAIPVSNSPLIADIDFDNAPELRGYVTYEPRDEGSILLETDSGAPLLAHRNVGLGHTWVFAADLKNRWVAPWLEWSEFANLFGGVLREMSAERFDPNFSLSLTRELDVADVRLTAVQDDGSFWDGLEPRIELSGVSSDTISMSQIAPGLYHARVAVPADPSGDLRIGVWLEDDRVAMSSLYTPQSLEYRSGPPDLQQLAWLSEVTGGRFEPTWEELVSAMDDSATRRVRLAPWLLAAALVIYLLELVLHRTGRLRPRLETAAATTTVEGSARQRYAA